MAGSKAENKKVRGLFERPAGSGVWWVEYYDAEGKRHREKAGSKGNAIKLRTQRVSAAIAGKKIEQPLRQRERTFGEYLDNAWAYSLIHKTNLRDEKSRIKILRNEFGNMLASSLTQRDFTSFLERRGGSAATFNRYRAGISMIYREAIRQGWTDKNPARQIKAKKESDGRIRFLTDKEEIRLRKAITKLKHPEQYLNEFEIALHTGMRKGEQFSLTWAQVDLQERRLTLTKTKNGSGRMIPLNSVAMEAFKRQKKITGHSPKVFLTGSAKEFGPDAKRAWLNEALTAAKIHNFSWHCFRHSFCSRLIQNGVSLKAAQELMGHKVLAMTARYAHLAPEHLQSAVDAIAGNVGMAA